MGREGLEAWVEITDTQGLYEVSNHGRVRSWNNNRWGKRAEPLVLKPKIDKWGYERVHLGRRSHRLVHRLVCEAFHGHQPLGMQAAHRDGDKRNNTPENLRWATPRDNSGHDKRAHGQIRAGSTHPQAKLSEDQVLHIRALKLAGVKQVDIAKQFGVAQMTVSNIVNGKRWAGL